MRCPTLSGEWNAQLVLENDDVGVWTVAAYPFFGQYATPEVFALDDEGGAVTSAFPTVGSGRRCRACMTAPGWGALAQGEVDARRPGPEVYVGSQSGNVYQLVAYPHGAVDARLIAHLPGLEIHTLLAGELDRTHDGPELLVFTRPGELYRLAPDGPDGGFSSEFLGHLPGRVRDALVLPQQGNSAVEIVAASRCGELASIVMTEDGAKWTTIHSEPMGMGRLALKPSGRDDEPLVLYASLDDGRTQRHERRSGRWTTETIYAAPQGPRGLAAGQFNADPESETLAVFGYARAVELLTRRREGWQVEPLFEDRDKGHWLSSAELDGRNGTREILGSGYGGRVFLLSRPPGYGLPAVATQPPPSE